MPFLAPDQLNIANIDEGAEALAQDENKVLFVNGIGQHDQPAPEAKIPEDFGDDALLDALAVNPLNDKAHHKKALTEKTYGDPEV